MSKGEEEPQLLWLHRAYGREIDRLLQYFRQGLPLSVRILWYGLCKCAAAGTAPAG